MPDVREVYEMVTKQKGPAPGALERQQRRQIRTARNRKIGAIAAAAAIVVAGIAVILGFRGGQSGTTPAAEPETASPVAPAPVEVAQGFVEAFGAFDADRAIAYLADDVDLSNLDAKTVEAFPLELALLEAMGYEQILVEPCRETGTSASGTTVRCPIDWHAIRSDEIGLGPYPGNWHLTVRDGEIASVSLDWNIERFSPQMWEPFAAWVSTEHPRSGAMMFNADHTNFQLTEESVRLWERRTREYVEAVKQGTAGAEASP
ncbi:MAG TPA: hypothetical protein VE669_02830 [Actinomycetota bacterium]|jgi:hypothetical protein|nr:hypothetical protein [Actinomycetota bacterium]